MNQKTVLTENKAIFSKKEFMDKFSIGESAFKTLLENGMPGRYENGRWYISLNNFYVWFDKWTAVLPIKEAVEGGENN